jgi:acetyl-CoA C-acetyltransferase
MPEAVIVSAVRTPIGRATKGSLVEFRPDDLAAHFVNAALVRLPEVAAADVEDLLLGCAQPAGEHGYNLARVVALLAGLGTVPASP